MGALVSACAAQYNSPAMSERADLDELARRYLDLWQDQMSALAGDEEFAETLQRLMTTMGLAAGAAPEFWRAWPAVMAGLKPAQHGNRVSDEQSREGAAGPASPAAASDGGEPGLDRLARRLAALEKRVAALETGAPRGRERAASKPRKRRS
jgi:uncharacterized protein YhaN